jgi:hypothetical protein
LAVLSSSLRRQLEVAVLAGRRAAEAASRAALEGLGVFEERRPEHLSDEQASLRRGLRAKWRQLGSDRKLLLGECGYEQWHRLLFARFLTENDLLLHPEYRAPVTLDDCEELAGELGEPDGWSVAARFAAEILPGIFRLDDPCFRLRLTPEGRDALEQVVVSLPAEVFAARDALGWVYQFWQKDKKDEINASERKIGGADLGPVTQLFTENYIVRFLLENSLGAWWASRHPDSPLIAGFEYLRFGEDGKPAAGSFEGWPERVAEVTVMDPCCGSGHFLVEAFSMLWQMRIEEEGLSAVEAQDAVLRDNLFGLELDPRCVQIAMFALALQAWKSGGGWRQLPVPNIACSGIPVKAPVEEWKKLAGGDQRLETALERLHVLFRDADTLGSLIDPRRAMENAGSAAQRSLEDVEWETVAPLLDTATLREADDPALSVFGADAVNAARAADLLSRRYVLVATNVPYLERRGHSETLLSFIELHHRLARFDLATAFVERIHGMCETRGTAALVVPQNWLFLISYRELREWLLANATINQVVWLGAGAFEEISGEVVKPVLLTVTKTPPADDASAWVLDASSRVGSRHKSDALKTDFGQRIEQRGQRTHAGSRILAETVARGAQLGKYVTSLAGMMTSDSPRFVRFLWEVPARANEWEYFQTTAANRVPYSGLTQLLFWEKGAGIYRKYVGANRARLGGAPLRGRSAWGRRGIAISQMGELPATMYCGTPFDNNVAVLVPHSDDDLPSIWAFCRSPEFSAAVRTLDRKMNVTNATLAQVPFDVEHWRRVAEEAGPLPEPRSDDPTQWLFEGRPEASTEPLQVAVARLLGYRWPEQAEADDLDELADADGIVSLPSVAGEPPAADRLQRVLATAFGASWSPAKLKELLEQTASKKSLGDWLRDESFRQHCALFGNRPFIWHVWDGQREGFAALVNYHRLDRKTLEKLTYTYLGQDWVERQRAAVRDGVAGAEARLAAALELQRKLEAILAGEAPYDIYVRWKELHEQPVGWEPDLNDGVRLNIRPFVEAGVLRTPFNINWKKDRGADPNGSERHNDVHLTVAEKLAARDDTDRP